MTEGTNIVVNTTHGPVRGVETTTIYDEPYYSFERIPYAQPPLGELRFKAPKPVAAWEQVLDCTQQAHKPMQKSSSTGEVEGSEDCLYLNVYAKQLQSTQPLPVMIFLFGGGFIKGDPTREAHGPDYFMMKDVILVVVAYRVGALGFLSLDDPTLNTPGNAGLKDQLLALKWIKANVKNFNGDANNITLFGESAGAASAHYLLLTPLAKDLFHKTILMSGSALCPWALVPVKRLAYRLAQMNGLKTAHTDAEVLQFLQQLPAEDLMDSEVLTPAELLQNYMFGFGPVIEPYESEICLLPRPVEDMLATAWGNQIPIMVGGTSFEGLIMYGRVHEVPFLLNDLELNREFLLPVDIQRQCSVEKQKILADEIWKAHFDHGEISMAQVLNYCDYASYKQFWFPQFCHINARLRHSSAPTFLYRFNYDSVEFNHQRNKQCGKELRAVAHYDDHSYIFYGNFSWKLLPQSPEYKTIERMIDIWTSFAANSNPNCKHTEQLHWTPLEDKKQLQCLNIAAELQVIDLPEMEKLQIWQNLYQDS